MEMTKEIVKYIEAQINKNQDGVNQEKLKNFIDQEDSSGFTALHLACFNGNLEQVQFLRDKGANIFAKNNSGLNVMHAAAQGDSPLILLYFKQLGFSIEETDDEDKSALFWAVFAESEHSVAFLLQWGADPNLRESFQGQTPLHRVTDSRITRKLLMAGARRDILDKKGNLPYQIAEQKGLQQIAKMLKGDFSLSEFCNLKAPLAPPSQKKTMLMILIFFGVTINGGAFIFIVPELINDYYSLCLSFYCLTILNFLLTIAIIFKRPGYCKSRRDREDLLQILNNHKDDFSKLCPDCHIVRPQRSRHCYLCGRCVQVYDHHCPWINNCIGSKNYFIFFVFLLSLWSFIAFLLAFHCLAIITRYNLLFKENQQANSISQICFTVFCIYSLAVLSIFIIPITQYPFGVENSSQIFDLNRILVIVQLQNTCKGQTQLERYVRHNFKSTSDGSTQTEKELEDSTKSANTHPSQVDDESQSGASFISDRRGSLQKEALMKKEVLESPSIIQNCLNMLYLNSKNPLYSEDQK